jgi:uncharacterized protein
MTALQLLAMVPVLLPVTLSVEGVPNPRAGGAWVSDAEDIIPAEAERKMNADLDALARELGVEVAVVTVSAIEGTPKDFATALFARWGIGKAGADNGLLVLLVRDQRRLEMETGYGLEPLLPDGWLGHMQNEVMVPAFRAGDFAGGLAAGLEQVGQRLRANPTEAREGTRRQDLRQDWMEPVASAGAPAVSPLLVLVLVGLGGLTVIGVSIWLVLLARRRERTCGSCQIEMRLLDEVADDAQLNAGQQREEALGSIDYRAYICPQCQGSRVVARKRWFSGFSRCPKCKYRTRRTRSDTLVEATYDHGGEVRVTESCGFCDHHQTYVRHTPRRTRPVATSSGSSFGSSSGGGFSSGGGSSFGGGSSGGGGAGSSW